MAFSTTTLEDVFLAVGEDDAVHNVAKVNERGESYKALYDPESIVDVPRSLTKACFSHFEIKREVSLQRPHYRVITVPRY